MTNRPRVLITGGGGQLAADLAVVLNDFQVEMVPRTSLDIRDACEVERALSAYSPDIVINTAAYHQVDRCETEPDLSFLVNAAAPQRLAMLCDRDGRLLVHFSTDYVFDGARTTPYSEDDRVHPLNVYGASKAAGEMAIRATTRHHLLIRTTGLYGLGGLSTSRGNFVETMLRLATAGKPVTVVRDQIMTPTATADLAVTTRRLIEAGVRGTVHVTNSGQCSWYEFASELFRQEGLSVNLQPTTQTERPLPARRPAYSVLAHDAIHRAGLPELRPWEEALTEYLWRRKTT